MWQIFKSVGNLSDFINFISNETLLGWATENIQKDWEDDAKEWELKFEALKPWLNPQLFDYIDKQKKRKEELKDLVANVLKVDSKKVVVKNAFEDELRKLGMTDEQIKSLSN